MKKYHEVGVILDANKRVGFVMKEGRVVDSVPYMVASMRQFEDTVKRGLVQYFEWSEAENTYKLGYTKEETRESLIIGMQPITDIKTYFQKDVHYKKRDIDLVVSGNAILITSMYGIKVPLLGDLCVVSVFASSKNQVYKEFCTLVSKKLNGTLLGSLVKYGGNNLRLTIDKAFLDVIDEFAVYASKAGVQVITDCSNIKRLQPNGEEIFGYYLKRLSKYESR